VYRLRTASSAAWLETVLAHFDAFLIDHAACERKASATALKLVAHYRDRTRLVAALIDLAREELDHFAEVYQRIAARGLMLGADVADPYVERLQKQIRRGRDEYFLDRLLVAGVVEARGCERFGLVARALEPGPLKDFYNSIATSEARHRGLFVELAREYFDREYVEARLDELLDVEASVIAELPLRPAVH
jgi:tRNA 2-(methylsulfanyl)-N6-isopentenyladenosine37 hydroxylase